jgi:hypothetical protein
VVSKIRKDMTTIDKFIDDQRNFVLRVFKGNSELSPMLCILSEKEDKTYTSMCPIPTELMTDEGKDIIRYGILEKVKESMKKNGHKLLCVNWNSEGWLYKSTKEELEEVDGYYRKLPRTEVLLMSFDTEEGSKVITYEIVRKMSVGVNGLNEEVEVELMKLGENFTTNGRFTNMF